MSLSDTSQPNPRPPSSFPPLSPIVQGEQYAVQKVLAHYTSDLRAIFLHYSQLDSSFTDSWPPSLTYGQWMLYCKDTQTSGEFGDWLWSKGCGGL